MIFEVGYPIVKKALTTIQNLLTATEMNKEELTNIELHVNEESVYFSFQEENLKAYQLNLEGAQPILGGSLLVNVRDLLEVVNPLIRIQPCFCLNWMDWSFGLMTEYFLQRL